MTIISIESQELLIKFIENFNKTCKKLHNINNISTNIDFNNQKQIIKVLRKNGYILFAEALKKADLETMKIMSEIIPSGAKEKDNMLRHCNDWPLVYSAKAGDMKMLEFLLNTVSSNKRAEMIKNASYRALEGALFNNRIEAVNLILSLSWNDPIHMKKLIRECDYRVLLKAIDIGHVELVNLILSYNDHIKRKKLVEYNNHSAFKHAVRSGHIELSERIAYEINDANVIEDIFISESDIHENIKPFKGYAEKLIESGNIQYNIPKIVKAIASSTQISKNFLKTFSEESYTYLDSYLRSYIMSFVVNNPLDENDKKKINTNDSQIKSILDVLERQVESKIGAKNKPETKKLTKRENVVSFMEKLALDREYKKQSISDHSK